MRQIKFRGKSMYSGEWLYGSLIINNEKRLIFPIPDEPIQDFDEIDQESITETIGQFTGLYDKQDNEIYEGDLVVYFDIKDDNEDDRFAPPIYCFEKKEDVVEFKNGMFCIDNEPLDWVGIQSANQLEDRYGMIDTDGYGTIITNALFGLLVVGNIHDNPEDF